MTNPEPAGAGTAAPVRLQLSRRKGFSLQALSLATNGLPAVNVARPSIWGNPFRAGHKYDAVEEEGGAPVGRYRCTSAQEAVEIFREWITCDDADLAVPENLRGKNLACWCAIGEPCHADVLLELANA